MARKSKTEAKPETEVETTASEHKYTVKDLEEAVGLVGASVRVGLRDSHFERKGRSWGWDTKKELDEVIAYFKERSSRRPTMSKAETETPAPKSRRKPGVQTEPDAPAPKTRKGKAKAAESTEEVAPKRRRKAA